VEKIEKYTRNEWRRIENTLETGGEDWQIHSKRGEKLFWSLPETEVHLLRLHGKLKNTTINLETTLETSGEDVKLHSKRVEKM
jgi:hypothetical protein